MAKIGLELNEAKTSVKHAREASFDFLGYTFQMLLPLKTGTPYAGAMPCKKAVARLKANVRDWLSRANVRPLAEVVAVLSRKLRRWGNYCRYDSVLRTRQKLDHHSRGGAIFRRHERRAPSGVGQFLVARVSLRWLRHQRLRPSIDDQIIR